ncbi:unnamed protein product [Mytilus coruscus]|uniref:Protein kinase domain-containing protein n=1 Tax=Mytilus coruscus TaxID=42192 RepID=A0A6J8DRC6_MYTCO|nr:unnamed protein product [Mytilus coruscus]
MSTREYDIQCRDDIIGIPDVSTGFRFAKSWGLNTKGIKAKDEIIKVLLNEWDKEHTTSEEDKGGIVLHQELLYHRGNTEKLIKLYDKVSNFYKDLPVNFQQDLNSIFPDIEKTSLSKRSELLSPECNILVAGEATSGKSSLINLLLEADILPTSGIKCTQTVCEIRKSKDGRKKAICFEAKGGKEVKIDLSTMDGQEKLKKNITIEDNNGDNPYDRIEIYWPTDVIEEGLVIIDTPGFGEIQMHKSLQKYLSKSCGFIYVVNTSNAGGVQKGRLKDFLRNVVNTLDEEFSPSSTLFVCNKWDVVPIKDREEIRRGIVYRLEQIFQGIRVEQIFYFSTTEAKRAMEYGAIDSVHKDFISKGLQNLFPASLRQQLNSHYCWLSQIVKRANYTLKVSKTIDAVDKQEMTKQMSEIKRNMQALEEKSRHTIDDLRKELQYEIIQLHKTTSDVLSSPSMKSILTAWKQEDCPRPDGYKKLAKEAADKIASKVSAELNKWEKEQRVVHSLKEKLIKKFKRDCDLLEDQIEAIEGTLLGEHDKKMIKDLYKSIKKQAPVKNIWRKAKRDDIDDIKGLGGAVAVASAAIASNKQFREKFKSYKKENSTKKMAEATDLFIESIVHGNDLQDRISHYLRKLVKGVDEIAKKIPEFLKADSQLLEKLTDSVRKADDNLHTMYPQFISSGQTIQGELDLFFVYHIMDMDYRLSDVEWNRKDLLGSGSFADVYKGHLKLSSHTEIVALKYCKDPLSERVVSDILLEDRTLRETKHPNIIQYYGCILQQSGETKRMVHFIMIMEYCDDTLKNKFLSPDYDNPGKVEIYAVQVEQMEELARYAIQICEGLEYLHRKKMVHRDMKLENILIVKNKNGQDVVKLSDVGLTKRERDISGTNTGSPVYMAPEVLVPTGIYDRKADIYALGILLWEMWYGIDVADHIQQQLYTTLDEAVINKGLRPSLSLKHKPDENWQSLLKSCWSKDKEHRPDATDVKTFFEQFLLH